jgi:GTP-binding protein HflX
MSQRLPAPSKNFYLGTGKLEELAALKSKYDYDVVVTDDELSPQQQQNLEERLDVKIIDRVALILDIFAKRAQTREGRLQVELAQHEYLLPRLAGQWQHLERLGGGIGTRGPGESQLETDRRLIRRRIYRLQSQLEQVRKQRHLYQARRRKSDIPVAAIVGYTNAGKSTLFNALTAADVPVEDKLFATLDPTTRRIALPDGRIILLSDTVGFIRKLPPTIVSAFRATLEELSEASVLLHVVDVASPSAVEQSAVVEDTLRQLDLTDKPRITVLNKMDLLLPDDKPWDEKTAIEFLSDQEKFGPASENTVLVSAGKKWGLTALLTVIGQIIARTGVTFSDIS